jgi:hypothetical protein
MVGLLVALLFPWALLVAAADLAYLFRIVAVPALAEVRVHSKDPARYWYVPLIVFVRSFATDAGFLFGNWQYHRVPIPG